MLNSRNLLSALAVLPLLAACSSGDAPATPDSGDVDAPAAEEVPAASATAPEAAPAAAGTTEAAPEIAKAETAAASSEPARIDGITNKRLTFAKGTSGATVEGAIAGYETIDYLLNVKKGQAMNISLGTKHTATYFNLLEPGETDVAIFNGSMGENMFEGVAQKSGDYRIRVYMMRSAARRDEKADYRLEANVS
ncbi:MAG: hypothetical protein KDE55_18500 [Novosphingobium sp.]|nr:hypothetical protein [Novosphingobium sp.]